MPKPMAEADVQIHISTLFLHSFLLGIAGGSGGVVDDFIYQCGIDFHNPYLNIYILHSLSSPSSGSGGDDDGGGRSGDGEAHKKNCHRHSLRRV